MGLDDALGYGESQARAAVLFRSSGRLTSESRVKYPLEIPLRDPAALVGHRHVSAILLDTGLHAHRATRRRVADGVVEQVAKNPGQLGGRQLQLGRRAAALALNPNPSGLRWGSGRGDGVRDEILQGDALQAKA